MIQSTAFGNIGRDAELKTVGKTQLLEFSLACNDGFGDNKTTTWINCKLWGARAEKLEKHFTKGTKLVVAGNLKNRKYTTKDGVEKFSTELNVSDFSFAGGPKTDGVSDDGIPF